MKEKKDSNCTEWFRGRGEKGYFHFILSAMSLEIGSGHGLLKLHMYEKKNLSPKFTAIVYHVLKTCYKVHHGYENFTWK